MRKIKTLVLLALMLGGIVTTQAQDKTDFPNKDESEEICDAFDEARAAGENQLYAFLKTLKSLARERGINDLSDLELINNYGHKVKCYNYDYVYIRDLAPIYKYAIDSGDYGFVRDSMSHVEDCTEINYNHIEVIELEGGKTEEETLLDYVIKIENDPQRHSVLSDGFRYLKKRLVDCGAKRAKELE